MVLTATQFRSNIYQILDKVLLTGESVSITRHGKLIKIVPPVEKSKLDRVKKTMTCLCDPETIVHMDWSKYWKPTL